MIRDRVWVYEVEYLFVLSWKVKASVLG